jgi:predicted ATPase/DNA-binding winged helix-turn-helix (wHTH) protein
MDEHAISFGPYRLLAAQRLLLEGDQPVRLGGRAFDILAALVDRAGEVVTKEQLMALAWPQTFVEDANLKIQVSALRRALGDGQGGNRYVITVSGRGYNFVAPVRREEPSRASPPPTVASVVTHNLPFAVTRMIGREEAAAALVARLSRQRLVTVVGPGGIGKTTVALAVAERVTTNYEHGVWMVDLAPLGDPRLVPSAVATVLGLEIRADDLLSGLVTCLRDKRMLLLLDSCEPVIDAAASLAVALLGRAPGVSVLATSRERLGVTGESEYHLGPLGLPRASARLAAAESATFPAVQLFVERVTAIVEDFTLTDANAPAIAEICRRLDGLPLAIEFAAPHVEALGVEGLVARLNDSLQLLGTRRRTAMPRHRTMRAVADWSYGLLSGDEQLFFRALGIFAGGFTVEAAAAVTRDAAKTRIDAIDRLADLVAKSLVVADVSGTKPRFWLFDTTRAYAVEKLRDHGEFDAVARRHAVFYCNYLEGLEKSWLSLVPTEDSVFHGRQVDNIRAANEWAFSSSGDGTLGVALTVAAVPFLMHFSLIDECAVVIRRVLTGDRAGHARTRRQEMKLFAGLASALLQTRASPEMLAAWRSAYEIAAELDDPDYRLHTLWGLWINCYISGDLGDALDAARQFATPAPGNTSQADPLVGERILGLTLHVMGDHGNALRHIDHMLEHYVAPPDASHLVRYQFDQKVTARCHKSMILWVQGLPEQAVRLTEYNLAQADAIGHLRSIFYALSFGACPVSALVGDSRLAQRFIQRMLDISVTPAWNTRAECFRGVLLVEQGRADGPPHLRAALKEMSAESFQMLYTWYLGVLARGLLARGELKEAKDTIQEALDSAALRKERWCEPELLRIKAEVVAALGHWDDASALFRQSLAVAQEQGALSWELRTATSLARLLRSQDRPADAIACLQPVYDRFTEGFGTADLIAAKQLLDKLSDAGRR